MLIGADLKSTRLIELILVTQGEWHGGRCGAWCGNNLIFFENGEVTKKVFGEDGDCHVFFDYEYGRYSIEDGVIRVQFESGESLEGGFVTEGPLIGTLDLGLPNVYFVSPVGDI